MKYVYTLEALSPESAEEKARAGLGFHLHELDEILKMVFTTEELQYPKKP